MYSINQLRKGLKIELDGEPYLVIDFLHVKPGKGGAFVRTKLKHMATGNVIDRTFHSGEKIDVPNLEQKQMQYLYKEGENYYFMDNTTYEQISLLEEQLGESKNFLKENITITALFHNGKPIGIELPTFVELAVVSTEPGVRGDTAAGGSKPARLETGAVVQVPLFVNESDIIRIDTRTGEYVKRIT